MDKKNIFLIPLFLLVTSLSFLFFLDKNGNSTTFFKDKLSFLSKEEKPSQEPKTEACPLNGELNTKTNKALWEKRRPLGIMVENTLEARPQSGLSNADVIFEVVAEGGITRFLSVFYCQDAEMVGPVRSARVYFVDFISGFGESPLYAHVGGANTPGPADAIGHLSKMGWAG